MTSGWETELANFTPDPHRAYVNKFPTITIKTPLCIATPPCVHNPSPQHAHCASETTQQFQLRTLLHQTLSEARSKYQ